MNTNAQQILSKTKQRIRTMRDSPMNVWGSVKRFLRYILVGRISFTLILLAWMCVISALIIWKSPSSPSPPSPLTANQDAAPDEEYVRYYNLHRVWFGEESIVMILFKMWYYAVLLWLAGPLIRELVVFAKLKMMV